MSSSAMPGPLGPTPSVLDHTIVFSALADPVRSGIVERLAREGAMTVGQLSAPFEISAPAISRHLNILEAAGILERTVDRQWRVCSLRPGAFDSVRDWIGDVSR